MQKLVELRKNQILFFCDYLVLYIKIEVVANKVPNHDAYITTQEFNKLTTKNFSKLIW